MGARFLNDWPVPSYAQGTPQPTFGVDPNQAWGMDFRNPMVMPGMDLRDPTYTSMANWNGNGAAADYTMPSQQTTPPTNPGQAAAGLGTLDWAKLGVAGLGTLGGLTMGGIALHQANQQFQFQKGLANRNYANSLKSYNNALHDRISGRNYYGMDQSAYDQQKLTGKSY